MADAQTSQSGPLFPNISLLDAKSFDFARWADFDDEAAVLYSAQDAGVRDENLYCACTRFFRARAKARLSRSKL